MSTEEDFWRSFVEAASSLADVDRPDREQQLDALLEALHRYHESLYFEVGGPPEGPNELVITAEGRREHFDIVKALVASAPTLDDWVFIALKPAHGFRFVTEYEGVAADPKEMWFLPLEDSEGRLGLRIAGPAYEHERLDEFRYACLLQLDGGLGEEQAQREVAHVEVAELPADPAAAGYIELVELPAFIQWRNGQKLH